MSNNWSVHLYFYWPTWGIREQVQQGRLPEGEVTLVQIPIEEEGK